MKHPLLLITPLLLIAFVTATLLVGPRPARALDFPLDVSQYGHTAWTIQDGSLKSGVRSITQTPDGYLWLATEFGLVRFDGVRFVPWLPPNGQSLPSNNIRSVAAARDGTLWIGTLEGLASWKDGTLTRYPELAGHNVLTLLEDHEGTVWAGAFGVPKGKLCAVRREGVRCYGEDGSLGQWVWSVYEDSTGALWAGAETGLWRWKPGTPKRFPMQSPVDTAQALLEDEKGTGLLAVGDGVWRLAGERLLDYPIPAPPGRTTPVNLFRDRNRGLWVGTVQRGIVYTREGRASLFSQSDGLSGNRVLSLFEDREGNVWVGTAEGLDRFRHLAVSPISVKQGLSSPTVWSVLAARDGSVWIGTLDGLDRWKDGRVTVYRKRPRSGEYRPEPAASPHGGIGPYVTEVSDPGLPDDHTGSLFEDDQGRIWVSTPSAVARFEEGRFRPVKQAPRGWVNAITSDPGGGVWICYQDHGLVRVLDDRVVEQIPWSKLGDNAPASSIAADPVHGGVWLGFFGGGVVYLKDGRIQAAYGKGQGLGGGRVMGLQLQPDGAVLAATEGGLSRIKDGRVTTLTAGNGLPCDAVHWTAQAGDMLWLYTPCGLLRIQQSELDAWASDPARTVHPMLLESADGVGNHALLTGYTPRVSKAVDGKLWFVHIESASVVDPLRLSLNTVPPLVHIEQITANGKPYEPRADLRLPPGIRDLAIDYTGLSFVAPDRVRFRFKLEGQDKTWREVVNNREVQYSNLPPRSYRFLVKACNNNGVWSEEGAALEFAIAPAYYQTTWFVALCAAALLVLLWALYQLRLRQISRQFNISLDARVGERLRIARDLHDTLLQSFQGILLYLQSGIHLLPENPGEARKIFVTAADQAERAIVEGRDAVQGLRTSAVDRNDLALAIKTLGAEVAARDRSRRPEFRVHIEGGPRKLHAIVRDEVYRIAGEALRNAFQHAEAKEIEVEIRYDDRELRLRIRDDGKGIAPERLRENAPQQGHFGLSGMRERAKVIGGKLNVWSELHAGTEVELRIPASRAYSAGSDERRGWRAEESGESSVQDTEVQK